MATNITAEFDDSHPNGVGSVTQKTGISLNDVVVNSAPNTTGGWTTATVTADKSRTHALTQATHGVPDGVYEATGLVTSGGEKIFRRKRNAPY